MSELKFETTQEKSPTNFGMGDKELREIREEVAQLRAQVAALEARLNEEQAPAKTLRDFLTPLQVVPDGLWHTQPPKPIPRDYPRQPFRLAPGWTPQ